MVKNKKPKDSEEVKDKKEVCMCFILYQTQVIIMSTIKILSGAFSKKMILLCLWALCHPEKRMLVTVVIMHSY